MTDLIVNRGDTFPRTYYDGFRCSRAEQGYNELKSSKSDELILNNASDIPIPSEIQHGRSENVLDQVVEHKDRAKPEYVIPNNTRKRISVYDKVDPEDSIRDIVSDNDFYRFVLFKKHYDKYIKISQKYEEAKSIAYYLEEKYHEIKTERDELLAQKNELNKRLESCESLIREKDEEVFVHLERVLYLEEQCEKLLTQSQETEKTVKKLEQARHELVRHMTQLKDEKECLEKENDHLKEILESERQNWKKHVRNLKTCAKNEKQNIQQQTEYESADKTTTLSSQFQKAFQHLATCKKKKCAVCSYTKTMYAKSSHRHKYDKKLLACIQTPFFEMRNILKPPPSPIHGEGTSLSEWFCPLMDDNNDDDENDDSLSIPFEEMAISYIDDNSETSSNFDFEKPDVPPSRVTNSMRGFESDSGFSSDICTDFKVGTSTPKTFNKYSASFDEDVQYTKLSHTKWTASFRKLIKKIRK